MRAQNKTKTNPKVNYLGMLVITWILIFMTIPFFYQTWKERAEAKAQLTECERMCYPSQILEDGENYCYCKPYVKSNLP